MSLCCGPRQSCGCGEAGGRLGTSFALPRAVIVACRAQRNPLTIHIKWVVSHFVLD